MNADHEFYSRRLREELQLADAAKTQRLRRVHVSRADEYGRWLSKSSGVGTADAVAQWKFRRQSDEFADWLAEVL